MTRTLAGGCSEAEAAEGANLDRVRLKDGRDMREGRGLCKEMKHVTLTAQ